MRKLKILIPVFVACLAVAGCGGNGIPDSTNGVMPASVLEKVELQCYWNVPVDLDRSERIEKLYLLDENLYCLTNTNRLIAVDAIKGLYKWSYQVADENQIVFAPSHSDKIVMSEKVSGIGEILSPQTIEAEQFDAVVINSLNEVVVLNRKTGKQMRRIRLDFSASTDGATNGKVFYIGSSGGRYYGIDLQDAVRIWTLSTEDLLTAPVVYLGGRVYIAGEDGTFRATNVSGSRGEKLWIKQLGGAVTAGFYVDGSKAFVPCHDNRLYGLNTFDGGKIWDPFISQGPLKQDLQVVDKSIFFYAERDSFYAIDSETGKKRWSVAEGRLVLMKLEGDVYLLDANKRVQIVDEITGAVSASFPLSGLDLFVGNTKVPAIYSATKKGRLVCIRPESAGHLKPEEIK